MDVIPMTVYVAVSCITPGPNNLMAMYLAANYGLRGSRRFIVASSLSFITKLFLCGALNLALAAAIPALVPYLKWVGAAYMLYLAYAMLMKGFRPKARGQGQQQGESTYRSGILLQLLNIKSWVMGLSVFSIYVVPYTREFSAIALCTFIGGFCMVASTLVWALCGSAMQRAYERHGKAFSAAMALSLVWCAVTAVL